MSYPEPNNVKVALESTPETDRTTCDAVIGKRITNQNAT